MYNLLLFVIYLSFISLGLPDSLLGSAWPTLHLEIGTNLSNAGIISMIISIFTIVSALFSDRLINKIGTGKVVLISVLDTAISMYLFSISNSFMELCLFAVPYGLGAGAIDASLNNYVALKMKASHMSWLHCMWGIGATLSPLIMSFALKTLNSWKYGYKIVSLIQLIIAVVLLINLSVWNNNKENSKEEDHQEPISPIKVMKLRGAKQMLVGFLSYCALEITCFVWTSTYFSDYYNISLDKAALLGSIVYAGLMTSRVLAGFVANKINDKKLINISVIIIIIFSSLAFFIKNYYFAIIAFYMIGFGAGPVYPSYIHATPNNFKRSYSQSIIGLQMAFAYAGSTLSPYIFGLIAQYINIKYLPLVLLIIGAILLTETNIYFKRTSLKKL